MSRREEISEREKQRRARQRKASRPFCALAPFPVENEHKSAGARASTRPYRDNEPLRFYRPKRLAALLGVHLTTVWRWRKLGILPPPIELSPGVRGWTERQIGEVIDARQAGAGDA